jgi:hypothetical protein
VTPEPGLRTNPAATGDTSLSVGIVEQTYKSLRNASNCRRGA